MFFKSALVICILSIFYLFGSRVVCINGLNLNLKSDLKFIRNYKRLNIQDNPEEEQQSCSRYIKTIVIKTGGNSTEIDTLVEQTVVTDMTS